MEINKYVGLTHDDCLQILLNINKDQGYLEDSISFEINPLSATPQGFGGEHFILTISYKTTTNNKEELTQRVFLKNLNASIETIADLCKSLRVYEKEEFLYNKFLKECTSIGVDISFAPEGYYARPYFLVMEDISQSGFHTVNKLRPFDFGQCRTVLDALAKFHMSVVIYEYEKRKINKSYCLANEHSNIVSEKVDKKGKMNFYERWFLASMDGFLAIIDLLCEEVADGINKDVFKDRFKCFLKNIYQELTPKEGDLCCMLHNDLWCNNIMFRYPSTATPGDATSPHIDKLTNVPVDPIDCKLIDYQLLSYGCPAADVLRVIHGTTLKETRDKHGEELLQHYFQRSVEYLQKCGLSPDSLGNWSWKIFSSTCDRLSLAMKLRSMAGRSMTFLSDSVLAKCVTERGMDRVLFEDRIDCMKECYIQGTLFYRTLINVDLIEVWSMLLKRE